MLVLYLKKEGKRDFPEKVDLQKERTREKKIEKNMNEEIISQEPKIYLFFKSLAFL